MNTPRLVIVATFALVGFCLCPLGALSPSPTSNALAEPPLQFELEVGSTTVPLSLDTPFEVEVDGKKVTL